jgi:hypothetical protein
MPSLSDQLATIRRSAEGDATNPGRIPPDALAIMHRVTADQQASDFRDRMPKIGQPAPAFTLANQDGAAIASADLLAHGPLVVSFFRGAW